MEIEIVSTEGAAFNDQLRDCQGQRPSISNCNDQDRNVLIATIAASTPTDENVGVVATVRMISAATKNSRPSNKVRPMPLR
jgi:hypothetical protein